MNGLTNALFLFLVIAGAVTLGVLPGILQLVWFDRRDGRTWHFIRSWLLPNRLTRTR